MRILVTGGAGFIGSNIVDKLIDMKNNVSVVDNLSRGKKENLNEEAVFYKCDITKFADLREVFSKEKPQVVIHHAAQVDLQASLKNPCEDALTNVIGTINVLECCREFKVGKIIYSSSAAVYGNPKYLPMDENHPTEAVCFYGVSKHTPTSYIKIYSELYGLDYTVLRYSNVYGRRQECSGEFGVVSLFAQQLVNNEVPNIFGSGEQTRDFIYIKDVVEANIKALTRGKNMVINIGSGISTTINELYRILKQEIGSSINPNYRIARPGEITHCYLSNTLAKQQLGWEPKFTLREGIRDMLGK